MAEFINSGHNEHLKIMFIRQSEGIYTFGSKRVNVKLEKGDLKCRVGGGYLNIADFVSQHMNVELEKMDKLSLQTLERRGSTQISFGGRAVTGLGSIPETPFVNRNSTPTHSRTKKGASTFTHDQMQLEMQRSNSPLNIVTLKEERRSSNLEDGMFSSRMEYGQHLKALDALGTYEEVDSFEYANR